MHLNVMVDLLLALSLSVVFQSSATQSRVPQFKDYPVSKIYDGKNAPLVLSRKDMTYRTKLREAAKEKPNFAGHYYSRDLGMQRGMRDGCSD